MNKSEENLQQKIVSLCKRRGFVFPGSEIYGGLANTYDFGPLGVLMLRNIIDSWWDFFVTKRTNMYGLDTAIFMSPKVWEASGHTASFNDLLVDCKECKNRTRADSLIEETTLQKVEGFKEIEIKKILDEKKIKCPNCGAFNWTEPRKFNLLFETHIGIVPENQSLTYLRGEIAQGMFVNFKNILDTIRPRLPFGIAQSGKVFRNEITKGNFIFRTLEFNLAEFEYFFDPKKDNWEKVFEYWQGEMKKWITSLGVLENRLKWRVHSDEERSHYSQKTVDLDYEFGFGYKELFGLAYRTDYDLKNHIEKSGADLQYTDPDTGEKFIPHVVEPTFGMTRAFLALLTEGYTEDKDRIVLKLAKDIAPYKVAVFPLVKNKPELVSKAESVYKMFVDNGVSAAWDDRGNIGKRYYAQDEIGTPFCVTVDYQTLEDDTVTLRNRDTTAQIRIKISDLLNKI
jgi:glycyl-tRNA synthetase